MATTSSSSTTRQPVGPPALQSVWNGRDSLTERHEGDVPRETSSERWCPVCRRWRSRKRFTKGYRKCRKCFAAVTSVRAKRNIAKAKARGICVRCRKFRSEPPHTQCPRCLERCRQLNRIRSARRRSNGRCTRCGLPNHNPNSGWYCRECSLDRYALNDEAMERALAKGICRSCRKRPVAIIERTGLPSKRCAECLERDAVAAKRRRVARKERLNDGAY